MACSERCLTPGKHATWGECIRDKGLRIGYAASAKGWDATTQKKWDAELQAYKDARAQGIQPAGTQMHQIKQAVELSDMAGKAYDASTRSFKD